MQLPGRIQRGRHQESLLAASTGVFWIQVLAIDLDESLQDRTTWKGFWLTAVFGLAGSRQSPALLRSRSSMACVFTGLSTSR